MRLDLVGDELDQVDSIWGRTRNGAKPAELNLYMRLDLVGDELNSIKLSRYGGELGGGELTMGRNQQLPLGAIYLSEHIFAPNGGYCLYDPSNRFRNAHSFENWGIFSDTSFSWGIFAHVTRLDQSSVSENI